MHRAFRGELGGADADAVGAMEALGNGVAAIFRGVIARSIIKPRYLIPLAEVERIKKLGNHAGLITGNSNAHYAHA